MLAGLPWFGKWTASTFLNHLYQVPEIKNYFDAAALQPYARNTAQVRQHMVEFRASMTNHGDGPTPLWVTEFSWGSGPPDSSGHNVGVAGQQQQLYSSFKLFLENRKQWNLQRLYWFFWRDPPAGSICRPVPHLRHRRAPPAQPDRETRLRHVQELHGGDHATSGDDHRRSRRSERHQRSNPHLPVRLQRARLDLPVPFRHKPVHLLLLALHSATPLPNGAHTFYVKAIDAPGNESQVSSRAFVVNSL